MNGFYCFKYIQNDYVSICFEIDKSVDDKKKKSQCWKCNAESYSSMEIGDASNRKVHFV